MFALVHAVHEGMLCYEDDYYELVEDDYEHVDAETGAAYNGLVPCGSYNFSTTTHETKLWKPQKVAEFLYNSCTTM